MTKSEEAPLSAHQHSMEVDTNAKRPATEMPSTAISSGGQQQQQGRSSYPRLVEGFRSHQQHHHHHSESNGNEKPQSQQFQQQPPTTAVDDDTTPPPPKRIRRVGKLTPRKIVATGGNNNQHHHLAAGGAASSTSPNGVALSLSAAAASNNKVLSKHDEKWNEMYTKLLAYKTQYGSTRVPQCYEDSKLGRWVHYQRVEYWIYQQSGNGKITPERIERLQNIGFEWDPQQARWTQMFEKLQLFKEAHGHCRVPKGYPKDPELANWVRNQRLEHANMLKGQKNRMTAGRLQKLSEIGFKWSSSGNAAGTETTAGAHVSSPSSVNGNDAVPAAASRAAAAARMESPPSDVEVNSDKGATSSRKANLLSSPSFADFDLSPSGNGGEPSMLMNHPANLLLHHQHASRQAYDQLSMLSKTSAAAAAKRSNNSASV